MKLPALEIRVADSIDHALAELATLGADARILAGGQSLLPLLRYRLARPHVLLDINRLQPLRELVADGEIRIGALVRHADLERMSASGTPASALLRAHARQIAFWPIRTRGTAVGSVVHADPKGDWPLAFFALDAEIELRSQRGTRVLPVREFVRGPLETVCEVDELATGLRIAAARARPLRWGRSKLMHRAGEYAVCSAIALQYDSGWECWMGAGGDRPVLLARLSALIDDGRISGVPLRAALLAAGSEDLVEQMPQMPSVERYRHAGNAADAAARALVVAPPP